METPQFFTDVLINDTYFQRSLIDNGSACYASTSEKLVNRLQLETIDIEPRYIEGLLEGRSESITKVAYASIDIGGNHQHRIFMYVVPHQRPDLILGRAWLQQQMAVIDEAKGTLMFTMNGVTVGSLPEKKYDYRACGAPAYSMLVRQMRRQPSSGIQVFAASLRDIEKALQVKAPVNPKDHLPLHYHQFLAVFDPKNASALPPHRPGIDHQIPLERDENGQEREVPWGPLYNMSREELLVLRKTLTELLDKNFIRVSKSSAGAPVLFTRKPGGGLRFCVDY